MTDFIKKLNWFEIFIMLISFLITGAIIKNDLSHLTKKVDELACNQQAFLEKLYSHENRISRIEGQIK